ncbi:DUF4838 domain-containing protein, partial [bacterium]|nr:DUF4838 domain-containing protein [bacterium]
MTSLTWAERFRVHHRPAEWLVRRLTDKFTELKFVVIDEVGIEVAGDGPALKRIQAELAALDQEPMEQEVMMQGLVLDRSAPLYGRAQEILRISPLGATFLRFWYRYVARHRSLLHAGQVAPVLAAIHSDFSHHVSGVWEDLVRSAIPFLNFGAQSWGLAQRWWGPGRDRKPLRHENCKEARMRIQITPEARVCPGGPKGPRMRRWIFGGLLGLSASAGLAQPLAIVEQGRPRVSVCVRPDAGPWEKAAAQDLATVVGKMTGVTLPILNTPPPADQDCIVVGELAIPALHERLQGTRRKTPILRHDAIALRSQPHRLWVAGSNDDSHYFAVAELMRRWGCRWYMPGDFGECIPPKSSLLQEPLDYAYAPPFEVRGYWLSWNGDQTGYASFAHRNFMNLERIPAGHALGPHIERVKAKLGSFETTSPEAAALVAEGLQADFSQGKSQSLSIEDATVAQLSDGEHDYNGGIRDKYFVANNMSDSYLLFYQRVARRLAAKFPHSKARLGFLAYVNLTLPPQRQLRAAAPLICYLAPIDIDPNHSDSPPKQDFFGALARWVQVMQGRVIIYDYDQSMLVWRDLPNPSQHVFQNDVKKYRKLGILGLDTESRGALATTFLNLYFRGQLMWNPDLDVDRELREFYPGFFGPAAQPMAAYWGRIYEAWKDTPVLEHEYFVIPHVYPRALVSQLKVPVAAGVREPYASRLRFAGLCQNLLDGYTRQLEAMATAHYAEAALIALREGLEAILIT